MGQIAVALKHLMAAGLSGDDLVHAIQEIEDAAPAQVDEQAERRRAKDRERKRKAREAGNVRGNPQTSAESADKTEATLAPLVPPLSPKPPNPPYNPPIPDQSQGAGDFELIPEQPKPKRTARANGQRLSKDWQPTPKDLAFATKHGLTPEEIDNEANRFRDTWISKSGAAGRKLDWEATWRNWITNPDLGPVARKAREAKRAASGGYRTTAQAKPRSGGIAAAGMRAVAEARGYGEPVS